MANISLSQMSFATSNHWRRVTTGRTMLKPQGATRSHVDNTQNEIDTILNYNKKKHAMEKVE